MYTDSEDGTGEDQKRRRNSSSHFRSSKQMPSLPVKVSGDGEIKDLLHQMLSKIKEIRKENKEFREEF